MKLIPTLIFIALTYSISTYSQIKTQAEKSSDNAISLIISGNYASALEEINSAIKLNPNNANYFYVRGTAYQKLNELIKALNDYKQVLKLNPRHIDAIMKCGIVYGKLNDKSKACEYLKMACELGEPKACEGYYKFCN
jgi:tetratricopeptide (TPR) repeat protein